MQLINIEEFFEDKASNFIDMAALEGGALYIDSTKVQLRSTKFINCRALSGGSIVVFNDASLDMRYLSIKQSTAIKQGGFMGIYLSA